jgi:threonine/homoserine/homoserine lactone efflux protein|tara:strand:- start:692 stop:1279 length:588 start_codon:yes stop_codon:yes gene_type:complete
MVIILVPGPSVLFAIGRALVLGTRAALISVFGNALGVGLQILIVALGLGVLIQQSPDLFFFIKVVGALMIGYLGLKAIWQRKKLDASNTTVSPSGKKVLSESIVVGITNAKTLVFFIAALPSFVDPSGGNPSAQMLVLGALFLIIGVTSDSVYAIAAGKARHWLGGSEKRLANFRGIGGLALTLLGLYMLLDALL